MNCFTFILRAHQESVYIYIYSDCLIGRLFANCPRDWGSIPGRVIPMTQKVVLGISLFNTQLIRYVSRVKWSNQEKGVAPSPTLRCSSYWKGSLQVTLDYGRQLCFTYIYIYIYIYIRGAFNKFPDFFVQAFKIVVDPMLLLYILWDDWPIFTILGSNEQLQQ